MLVLSVVLHYLFFVCGDCYHERGVWATTSLPCCFRRSTATPAGRPTKTAVAHHALIISQPCSLRTHPSPLRPSPLPPSETDLGIAWPTLPSRATMSLPSECAPHGAAAASKSCSTPPSPPRAPRRRRRSLDAWPTDCSERSLLITPRCEDALTAVFCSNHMKPLDGWIVSALRRARLLMADWPIA